MKELIVAKFELTLSDENISETIYKQETLSEFSKTKKALISDLTENGAENVELLEFEIIEEPVFDVEKEE